MAKPLKKFENIKGVSMCAGVCAGISYFFSIKTKYLRIACILLCIFSGILPFLMFYALVSFLMPIWAYVPADYKETCE